MLMIYLIIHPWVLVSLRTRAQTLNKNTRANSVLNAQSSPFAIIKPPKQPCGSPEGVHTVWMVVSY